MKFLKKYGGLAALLIAVTVRAQAPAPAAPVKLSPSEMRTRVELLKKQVADDHRHVLHLQAVVRKDKDVIKLTCVNDKLLQMKAQLDLFETASLQVEAADGVSEDALQASFKDADAAGTDVRKLRAEADGCAGALEMYKQESNLDVDRPPGLDDPTDTGGFDGGEDKPDVEVPGFATPWK